MIKRKRKEADSMKDYIIVTDSTIDLTDEMAKELGILVLPMTFTIDGKE